jgi:hypothetical protein
MHARTFVALVAILLLACSTTSMKVEAAAEPGADFASWRTFAWVPEVTGGNVDVDAVVRSEVEARLTERGYELDPTSPDFLVDYQGVLENRTASESVSSNRGNRPARARSYEYLEGSIVIEFLDPQATRVLWHGVASDDVPLYGSSRKGGERVPEAVERIISKVPKARSSP